MHPVQAQSALAAALEHICPVAESLGATIKGEPADVEIFGNHDKLVSGLVWLLDHLLALGNSATLDLKVDDTLRGAVHIWTANHADVVGLSNEALMLAQTALGTMGVEVTIESQGSELRVELQLSSYRHPAARTSVIVGDF
jgi:hypothetical protein